MAAPRPAQAAGWRARLAQSWGKRTALGALLLPLAALYGGLAALRRALYQRGWLRRETLGIPVVVVGNLVAGGAGKTPTVIAIARMLRARGWHPGIVSRGYGRAGDAVLEVLAQTPAATVGDEPLVLQRRSGAPVVVGVDRVAAGRELRRRHPEVDVVIADDGLQHLRLARDVAVLVFDERGAGNGWLLPAGPLREPLPAVLPPHTVVLYNADAATTPLPGWLAKRGLAGAVALGAWWQGAPPSPAQLEALRGRPLVAAAGLARPERYFALLRAAGLHFESLTLPDHHDYATLPWPAATPDVIVTEKDAVKLAPERIGATRVWVAALDFETPAAFDAALLALLPGNDDGNATA